MIKNINPEKYSLISKIALCCMIILYIYHPLKAQDKIHKTDSTIIETKVLEIGNTEIKYKKFSNQNGPTYTISKTEVQMIVYENGEKEIFNTESNKANLSAEIVKKDSLQCIEDMWGVKLENTTENGGGVKIIKLESNSIFKQGISLGIRGTLLTNKLTICYVNNGGKVRVKNTAELARVIFESYKQGISKINLVSERNTKLSYLTYDPKGIDITGISKYQGAETSSKKLGITESKNAGRTVSGIYHPGQMWAMQGFCSGMVFGLAGIGIIAFAAILPPNTPKVPPNVDANAWSNGYRSRINKKRLISGILGSLAGAALVIGAFSSAN
jgi:hypothetical protein